jgi:outer membrane lipoprotein-sorting protein
MRQIFFISVIFLIPYFVYSQQDPEAKIILDQVSAKVKNCQTIQSDFELVIENKRENKSSKSKGLVKIKAEKYYMESMGSKVYFDGKTLWSYMEDVNEVTISQPSQVDNDFVENPSKIFTFYNRDFKYHLIGEARMDEGWMYEIDLFPISLDQPYSRIKLFVNRENKELFLIKAVAKDGISYSVYIRNTKYDLSLDDNLFQFLPEKHKGIEVVDLR